MPTDCDTVFMQEDVERDDGRVTLPPGLRRGANMRPVGEDIARGGLIISAGRRLRPQDLALAAATGAERIAVRKRLRVAIFSTGNELTQAGKPLGPGAIYESNGILMGALLTRLGAAVTDFGILRDDPATLSRRLTTAAPDHDLILTSGGVSMGEEDQRQDGNRSLRAHDVLATCDQTRTAACHGPCRWHAGRGATRQSGGGLCDARALRAPPAGLTRMCRI